MKTHDTRAGKARLIARAGRPSTSRPSAVVCLVAVASRRRRRSPNSTSAIQERQAEAFTTVGPSQSREGRKSRKGREARGVARSPSSLLPLIAHAQPA